MAAGAVLAVLALTADGPLGILRVVRPGRCTAALVVGVAVAMAVAACVPSAPPRRRGTPGDRLRRRCARRPRLPHHRLRADGAAGAVAPRAGARSSTPPPPCARPIRTRRPRRAGRRHDTAVRRGRAHHRGRRGGRQAGRRRAPSRRSRTRSSGASAVPAGWPDAWPGPRPRPTTRPERAGPPGPDATNGDPCPSRTTSWTRPSACGTGAGPPGRTPWPPEEGMAEVADGVAFVPSFANVAAVTTDDGLILVDVGSPFLSGKVHRTLRTWTDLPPPHRRLLPRAHRPRLRRAPVGGRGRRAAVRPPRWSWPTRRWPPASTATSAPPATTRWSTDGSSASTTSSGPPSTGIRTGPSGTGSTSRSAACGPSSTTPGARPTTTPGRGSRDQKVLCTGDLFIWASPNAGNPQKVQRFPLEWAEALRRMLALYDAPGGGPEVLLPGHGYPILGEDRIRRALSETAELLESLVAQTLELMNAGARLDEAIHSVDPARPPDGPPLPPARLRRAGVRGPRACGASTAAGGTATRPP